MKSLAATVFLFPSLAWADCSQVGAVLADCDGSRGYHVGNQTYVPAPGGGFEPYHAPAPNPYNPVPSVQPSYAPAPRY